MKTRSLLVFVAVVMTSCKQHIRDTTKPQVRHTNYLSLDDRPPFRVTLDSQAGYSGDLIDKLPLGAEERTIGPLSFANVRDAVNVSSDFGTSCGPITDHSGWVLLDFTIGRDGAVRQVRTLAVRSDEGAGEDCIVRTLQNMRFPSRDAETFATFPFQTRGAAKSPLWGNLTRASLPAPSNVVAPPLDAMHLADGLASEILQHGSGTQHPGASDTVFVNYVCWSTDGQMIDRGQQARVLLKRIIPGWSEGIQLMTVGEKRRVWIPQNLAFNGSPPTGTLVLDLELLQIIH